MAIEFNKPRDVLDSPGQPAPVIPEVPVDRQAALQFFDASFNKAVETQQILDELGRGFSVPLGDCSEYVRTLVQILDPESKGEYLSWETYKRACDICVASSFPDLEAFENMRTGDAQRDHEIFAALMQEQTMGL